MAHQKQKFISTLLLAVGVVGGFEALIYLLNLNQLWLYVRVSLYLYVFLVVKMMLLYDLHFKNPGVLSRARARHESTSHKLGRWAKVWLSALYDRFYHLLHWRYFRHYQNYLILPGLLYWSTVGLLYINFGHTPLLQTFAMLASAALIVCFWYLKEIFYRKNEKVDGDIITALTVIKLYTAFLVFAAAFGLGRYFCLPSGQVLWLVALLSFWLIYQALFQNNFINSKSLLLAVVIALVLSAMSSVVYGLWGLNYFTAAVFMMAWYNFFWNIVSHFMHKERFNWRVFAELLLTTLVISAMMIGVTNFKARLVNAC